MYINRIAHDQQEISTNTALPHARNFGIAVEFWTGIQTHYEGELAKMNLADRLEKKLKLFTAA